MENMLNEHEQQLIIVAKTLPVAANAAMRQCSGTQCIGARSKVYY